MVHYGGSTQWKLFRNDRTLGGGFFLFCFITTRGRIHEELRKIFIKAVLTPLWKTGAFSTVVYPGSRGPFSKYLIWNIRAFSRRFAPRWRGFAANDQYRQEKKYPLEPRVTVVSICAEWWQGLIWFGFLVLLEVCLLFFTDNSSLTTE